MRDRHDKDLLMKRKGREDAENSKRPFQNFGIFHTVVEDLCHAAPCVV